MWQKILKNLAFWRETKHALRTTGRGCLDLVTNSKFIHLSCSSWLTRHYVALDTSGSSSTTKQETPYHNFVICGQPSSHSPKRPYHNFVICGQPSQSKEYKRGGFPLDCTAESSHLCGHSACFLLKCSTVDETLPSSAPPSEKAQTALLFHGTGTLTRTKKKS